MDCSKDILQYLDEMHIPFTLYRHEPMLTIEACQDIKGVDWKNSAMCKNVFLCNRQETQFYLLLLRHDRAFRTAVVSKLVGVSRLSFAKPDKLMQLLKLEPGAVNPLSLIFDTQNRIQLAVDESILSHQRLLFHPGVNHLSVSLTADDFLNKFLPGCRHRPNIITIPDN